MLFSRLQVVSLTFDRTLLYQQDLGTSSMVRFMVREKPAAYDCV